MTEQSIKRWAEFRDFVIDSGRQTFPVYWRGQQRTEWPLASLFEREILKMSGGWRKGASLHYPYDNRYKRGDRKIWEDGFYQKFRDSFLHAFKKAAVGTRGSNPPDLDEDQWWALGRHFGLITPLLDWSESPYIAVFFPLAELLRKYAAPGGSISFCGDEIALYRLVHSPELEGDGLRVLTPVIHELIRMHGQRGLFTWLDSEDYFELEGFTAQTGRAHLLTRVLISDQALFEGLGDLRSHGIDYSRLFPDLHGAALHANFPHHLYRFWHPR